VAGTLPPHGTSTFRRGHNVRCLNAASAKRPGPVPSLTGERALLRAVTANDHARLAQLVAAPEVARWWGVYEESRMRAEVAAPDVLAWTVEVEGEIAGLLLVTEEREPEYPSVELDIFIAVPHQGQGLGPDAIRTALRWLFGERGHHRATIAPATDNVRAIAAYQRVGFRPVGVLRQADRLGDGPWQDALLMDLLADELG
jgi:aminoglycoside 6'-N-acetyltransferase